MIKNPTARKTIAIFLLLNFLSTLAPYNALYANNNGPNAPEAAAFEPVDATDMVNLVTGNLSYVLPLLNIPSPEGGYPLALSYHAGIAMDQEASWVGLGWNLNPGAINRGVNGYPDDWGETNISEFFYDKGWSKDYYSFSIGATLGGTLTVGLGLSWGSNQSLGGYVNANIGLGGEKGLGPNLGVTAGTNGVNFNVSLSNGLPNGFGVDFNSNGSLNVSYTKNGISSTISTEGFSIGVSRINGNYSFKTGLFSGSLNLGKGTGISFDSKGNAGISLMGTGFSLTPGKIDSGDYDIAVSNQSFFLPVYIFYIGFNHTNVKYSLYKYNNLYTSGILNPVLANKLQNYDSPNQDQLSRRLKENHFMDINVVQPFYEDSIFDDLIDESNQNDRNNLVFPNYDSYSLNAQGISGNITPYNHVDLILSGRGRGEQNNDNEYVQYLNYDISEYQAPPSTGTENGPGYNAIRKKYFTFLNEYNSFLRLETSNIHEGFGLPSVHSDYIMEYFKTDITNNFMNYGSINTFNQRKKEGNFIETYTNKEIREGNITNFIDAREGQNVLNRSDTNVFLDEGIGAFKITTIDGKTYHYSLPVYQFESFYKNFKDENANGDPVEGENSNFFEIEKRKPYATHWLLTAITGPDYVDKNNNGRLDKGDFGYWVDFEYGKWADGYVWRTPSEGYDEIVNKENNKKTYSYSWGVKQLYYLDVIKTRTHKALFIKDLRDDDKSSRFDKKKQPVQYNNEVFNPNIHSLSYDSAVQSVIPMYMIPEYQYHNGRNYETGETYTFQYQVGITERFTKSTKCYLDIKESKPLKLSKIILVKNQEDQYSKNRGQLIEELSSYFSKSTYLNNYKQRSIFLVMYPSQESLQYAPYPNGHTFSSYFDGNQPTSDPSLKEIKSHYDHNILDTEDIKGLNLEETAVKVIEFEHDYSLAKGAPNTSNGRLSLKKVYFKGKKGEGVIPPYEFLYQNSTTQYSNDNIDAWGYYETNPAIWSLNEITTPTGAKLKIEYESDVHNGGAAYSEQVVFSDILSTEGNRINFSVNSLDASSYFSPNLYYKLKGLKIIRVPATGPQGQTVYREIEAVTEYRLQVQSVGENWIEFNDLTEEMDIYEVYGNTNGQSTSKDKGGIRTGSIAINDGIKDVSKTEYTYIDGITSYEPSKEQIGVPYLSELPAPLVMYGRVEMETKDGNSLPLGKTVFEFETLKPRQMEDGYIFSLGECFRVKENQNTTLANDKVIVNKFTIENKLGNLGRINSIKSYNSKGQLLSNRINTYKTDLDSDGEIGVTQETHTSYKRVKKNNDEKFYVSSTSKIDYPSVLESVTETSGGMSITKNFDKYDFLTGQVLETSTYASDGKAFKTKIVPAYKKYSEMGSKVDDINNKNMLSQTAGSISYVLKEDNWQAIGADITTWSNDWEYKFNDNSIDDSPINTDVWRKHKNFVWDGEINEDGTYTNFTEFDFGVSATNLNWKETKEITRYDQFSKPLEVRDINNNFAATKMGDAYSKVIATSNSGYDEMYYTGAEYISSESTNYFDGGIMSAGRTDLESHTGNHSVKVTSDDHYLRTFMERDTHKTGKYKISVWAYKSTTNSFNNATVKVNNSEELFNGEKVYAGNWVMLNHYVDLIDNVSYEISLGSESYNIYYDDFRIHPVSSSMISYVYNEWDEVSYITGANGLSTHYVYDDAGRLVETWVEVPDTVAGDGSGGFKLVNKNSYNYKENQ